jgi:septal ring factor EnvC (AmiA/AmiB activator)
MIEVLGVKNADKLVPTTDDAKPVDPVSENMNALNGKPLKAFIYQDHDAHMAVHQSFLQDPSVAATIGQNPQAQRIAAALQAHIAEHLGFKYRKEMEEKVGAPLPNPNAELPENMEVNLARLMAQAGGQLTQQKQQQAAQQQAQQKAQDPVVQMQQAELQIKQQEVQRKAAKDQADAQIEQAKLQLQAQENMQDAQMDQAELALKQQELQIDAQKAGAKLAADRRKDNTKLDLDLLKTMKDSTPRDQ